MSILNDLKRVFFGAKSVAKHQGGKAADALKDVGDNLADEGKDLLDDTKAAAQELVDKAPEYFEKGKDALEDLTDKIWRDADAAVDKAKAMKDQASDKINSKLEELNPTPEPAPAPKADALFGEDFELDLIESDPADLDTGNSKLGDLKDKAGAILGDVSEKASAVLGDLNEKVTPTLDAAAKAGLSARDKIADVSEKVGKEVMEKGDEFLNRAAEAGAEAKSKFDDFVDHANTEAEKMKMEDAIEEAKAAAEQAEARARAFDGAEGNRDTSESTLSGTDSFFDRADRFAKGDYHGDNPRPVTVQDNPDAPKKTEGGIISGFLDEDGDGDSLIDDAQIVEEE